MSTARTVWQRGAAAVALAAATVALAACGGGAGVSSHGSHTGVSRGAPVAGRYVGALADRRTTPGLIFAVGSHGQVTGEVRLESGGAVRLTGTVKSDGELAISGQGWQITGRFYGAWHPQSSSYYETRGVHFVGQWVDSTGDRGDAEAWYENWPPSLAGTGGSSAVVLWPLINDYTSTTTTYVDGGTIIYDTGGSTSGSDTSSTSSSGGSSTGGGTSTSGSSSSSTTTTTTGGGGSTTLSGGGDPLGDDFVVRQSPR